MFDMPSVSKPAPADSLAVLRRGRGSRAASPVPAVGRPARKPIGFVSLVSLAARVDVDADVVEVSARSDAQRRLYVGDALEVLGWTPQVTDLSVTWEAELHRVRLREVHACGCGDCEAHRPSVIDHDAGVVRVDGKKRLCLPSSVKGVLEVPASGRVLAVADVRGKSLYVYGRSLTALLGAPARRLREEEVAL